MKEILLEKAAYLHKDEQNQFRKAIHIAEKAHEGQFRVSGEPFITHPFAVTEILLDCRSDATTVIAALLHDVVEDTAHTIEDIESELGKKVAAIVDGLTKIDKKQIPNKEEYEAVNVKKLLLATQTDIRVAVIKVIDRLHNMRTLHVKAIEKQVPYANETVKIFSPLCKRLGLIHIQKELEELAFLYLHNPKYYLMQQLIKNYTEQLEDVTEAILKDISNMKEHTSAFEVDYEMSPIYTAYSSLQEIQHMTEVANIYITTTSELDCYKMLGIIHQLYEPISHQFIDYIATEHDVFHRYLQTKLRINDHEIIVRIQTKIDREMRKKGVFSFLEQGVTDDEMKELVSHVIGQSITANEVITEDARQFYDFVSFELFQETIVTFTPKLKCIRLPKGATVIDFAYAFDPAIAAYMLGVKVNGVKKSITEAVSHLDIIEILVIHDKRQVCEDWLNFVMTAKARMEIERGL